MSTFGFFPGSSTISGLRVCKISKLRLAACLSATFVPDLSLMFPNSFRTSWGTIHLTDWLVTSEIFSLMSSFCLTQVRMKFVSSKIFMVGGIQ